MSALAFATLDIVCRGRRDVFDKRFGTSAAVAVGAARGECERALAEAGVETLQVGAVLLRSNLVSIGGLQLLVLGDPLGISALGHKNLLEEGQGTLRYHKLAVFRSCNPPTPPPPAPRTSPPNLFPTPTGREIQGLPASPVFASMFAW